MLSALGSTGCFAPEVSEGVTCGTDNSCPPGMQCDPLDNSCRFELRDGAPSEIDAGAPDATLTAVLEIDMNAVDFGTINLGQVSGRTNLTVTNIGAGTSQGVNAALMDGSNFTIIENSCEDLSLEPQASCQVGVAFSPGDTAAGAQSDTLTLEEPLGANELSVALAGLGLGAGDLDITDQNFNFGSAHVGDPATPKVFTITNKGSSPSDALETSIANSNEFVITEANNTCNGQSLAASGGSCTVEVVFTPELRGDAPSRSLVVQEQSGASGVAASLDGTGTFTLTVVKAGASGSTGDGTITSDPLGLSSCVAGDTQCSGEFSDASVTLTQSPANTSSFVMWSEAGMGATTDTLVLDMTADKVVEPVWSVCEPRAPTSCDMGGTEQEIRCNAAGNGFDAPSLCAMDCLNSVRCADVDPSNNLGTYLDIAGDGTADDITVSTGFNILTDDANCGTLSNGIIDLTVQSVLLANEDICVLIVGTMSITGDIAVIGSNALAIVSNGAVTITNSTIDFKNAAGAAAGCSGGAANASEANVQAAGGGGGGHNGTGGAGGDGGSEGGGSGGPAVASGDSLDPLRGGCKGATCNPSDTSCTLDGGEAGQGGGAIQIVSRSQIAFNENGIINAGGKGGGSYSYSGILGGTGGGAGGGILLEAPRVTLSPMAAGLYANGGGGGGAPLCESAAGDGRPNVVAAAGASCSLAAAGSGGNGGFNSGTATNGTLGSAGTSSGGGGGGAGGFIRVNTFENNGFTNSGSGNLSPLNSNGVLGTR